MSDKVPETPDKDQPDSAGTAAQPPVDPTAAPSPQPPADPTSTAGTRGPELQSYPVPDDLPASPYQGPDASYPPPSDPYQQPSDPYQQPGMQPPGYGPQGHYQVPPGQNPWQSYPGTAGAGVPGYGGPGYGLPPGYYAGPEDPLVSADFAGWWRRSFTLLSADWLPIIQVQLIWAVPLLILGVITGLNAPDTTVQFDPGSPDLSEAFGPLRLVPFTLIAVLLTVVAQMATLDVLVQHATGRPVSVGQALINGLRRFPALLGWQILAGLVILLGACLLVLPGIYAAAVLLILPVIILLERGEGIGRAFQLFHANLGASAGRIATVFGLNLAFTVAEFVGSEALSPLGDATTAFSVSSAVLSAVFSVATGVVISPLLLTAYADMRARHEPFSTAYLLPAPPTS